MRMISVPLAYPAERKRTSSPYSMPAYGLPLLAHNVVHTAGVIELFANVWTPAKIRAGVSTAQAKSVVHPAGSGAAVGAGAGRAEVVVVASVPLYAYTWMRQPAPHVCDASPAHGTLQSEVGALAGG
jgi:hypothetical protein